MLDFYGFKIWLAIYDCRDLLKSVKIYETGHFAVDLGIKNHKHLLKNHMSF